MSQGKTVNRSINSQSTAPTWDLISLGGGGRAQVNEGLFRVALQGGESGRVRCISNDSKAQHRGSGYLGVLMPVWGGTLQCVARPEQPPPVVTAHLSLASLGS